MTPREQLNPSFTRWHLPDGLYLNRIADCDHGNPHDHPFTIDTEILDGGYVEEVYTVAGDGTWSCERIARLPGTSHTIATGHIHRVVELPNGPALTLNRFGPRVHDTRFWRFVAGQPAVSRQWDEAWL